MDLPEARIEYVTLPAIHVTACEGIDHICLVPPDMLLGAAYIRKILTGSSKDDN